MNKKTRKLFTWCIVVAMLVTQMLFANVAFAATSYAGTDRYQTALQVVKAGWTTSDNAVIARGDDLADALAAAPLAYAKGQAPILLTETGALPAGVMDELTALGVKNVYIVGGTGAVSSAVETALAAKFTVKRLAGADRYATSLAVAQEAFPTAPTKAVLVNGYAVADALSISSIAAYNGMPILLVDKDTKSADMAAYLTGKTVYAVGGAGVLSDANIGSATRLSGADRYATNVAVLKAFTLDYSKVYVAVGEDANSVDALGGAALAAKGNNPMVLVNGALTADASALLKDNLKTDSAVFTLGGVVPASVATAVEALRPVNTELAISSVKAVDSNTLSLVFNQAVNPVDALNFDIDGSNTVIAADLATDNKTVEITLGSALVDGATYTVTASDVSKLGKTDEVTVSSTFTYDLSGIASITLTKNEFAVGENIADFVSVKDKNGLEVSSADYTIDKIESSVETVVDPEDGSVDAVGTSNIRLTVNYLDEETVVSGFLRVDVKSATTGNVTGFELAAAPTEENAVVAPDDALEMYVSDDPEYLQVYAKDSLGNPMTSALDLSTEGGYTVTCKNLTILAVSQDATGALIDGLTPGTATINIVKGSYKQTVTVTVLPDPVFKDLYVPLSGSTVKLSDETANADTEEGVNQATTSLRWIDQNGDKHYMDVNRADDPAAVDAASTDRQQIIDNFVKAGDKLVISSSADAADPQFALLADDNNGGALDGHNNLVITATQDESITGATVKVSYYAKTTDTTPKVVKTFKVSVTDINPAAVVNDYEVAVDNKTLQSTDDDSTAVDDTVSNFTIYSLDSHNNRLADITADVTLSFASSVPASVRQWFNADADGVFPAQAVEYGNGDTIRPDLYNPKGGSVTIEYTVGDTDPHGAITLTYGDTTGIPYAAAVNNKTMLLDLSKMGEGTTEVTLNQILFGKANASELVLDDLADADATTDTAKDQAIAVKVGADGYYYAPVVTMKDIKGALVDTGVNVYGFDTVADEDGNCFTLNDDYTINDTFTVEAYVTNAKNLVSDADATNPAFSVGDDGNQATFTLVITSITMTNDPNAAELLNAPVAVNVVLQ